MTQEKDKKTLEQRIAAAQDKLNRLRAQERSKETRQKIIVGAVVVANALDDPARAARLIELLEAKVTRDNDRKDIAPLLDKLRKASGASS